MGQAFAGTAALSPGGLPAITVFPRSPDGPRYPRRMTFTMSDQQELERRLAVIARVFNVERIATRGQDSSEIERYYRASSWGYQILHSKQGAIHMALNPEGVFTRDGYYGQPDAVASWFASTTGQVLELASGNGFNACYLAAKFPRTELTGIDLTRSEVGVAKKRSREIGNATFLHGNFQHLPFEDNSFDLVYVIESICHATDMELALSEAYRVLRPKGVFIVIDAWQTAVVDQLSPLIQKAAMLTQQSMSVGKPWKFDRWLGLTKNTGFTQVADQDLTAAIVPNLLRFEHMAIRYFSSPHVAYIIARILPSRLIENAIAGYLMPLTVRAGAHTYRMVVFTR
jgi:ubiquinone/menaquinone biosynthesis C-methylase UbiE